MASGFLYVLVNSSIPGLVKVGKTTRTPSERVGELSGVTGVPTPFIVAYEEYFCDCDAAEQFVHSKLTERGVRVSDSREFFRAAASDVVKIIASIPPILTTSQHDEGANKVVPPNASTEPWKSILERADDFYYGLGDNLRSPERAYRLYQDAAKLGSLEAVECLGNMHFSGEAVREDRAKGIELFMRSALAGNYFSYARLATVFGFTKEYDNALKAAKNFVTGGESVGWSRPSRDSESHLDRMFEIVNIYGILRDARWLRPKFFAIFGGYAEGMLEGGRRSFELSLKYGNAKSQASILETIELLQSLMTLPPASVPVSSSKKTTRGLSFWR